MCVCVCVCIDGAILSMVCVCDVSNKQPLYTCTVLHFCLGLGTRLVKCDQVSNIATSTHFSGSHDDNFSPLKGSSPPVRWESNLVSSAIDSRVENWDVHAK